MARWGNSKKSSGRHIAGLLDCHGFTPTLANAIRRWYRANANPAALAKIDGRKEAWRRYSSGLTSAQLKAFGDFVNEMMEAAFVSGVRIGLSTRLVEAIPESPEMTGAEGSRE